MNDDPDLCEVARALEKVHEENVVVSVAKLAAGRTDAYWSGFSQACEEIAHRLGVPFEDSKYWSEPE